MLLAHHPDVRARAVRAADQHDEDYLGALVREVLRIRPPLPIAAGRILDEDVVIGGHDVPAGTPILIDSLGVHHDPGRWPEPERFDPQRFLHGSPEPYSWLPFGGGAHRCIGSGLAEMEIGVALATMLRTLEITPAGDAMPPPVRRAVTLFPSGGGRVRAAARSDRA